jgi:hypothetical protein
MSSQDIVALKKILDLSELMLAACQSCDWDLLVTLEAERGTIILQFFEKNEFPEVAMSKIKDMLEAVLEIDNKIMLASSDEAANCQRQLAELGQGRKAVSAYNANS